MFLIPIIGGFLAVAQAAIVTAVEWAVTSAIIGGLIGGGVGAGSEIIGSVSAGEEIKVAQVAESALHGAATGAIGGAASGAVIGAAVGRGRRSLQHRSQRASRRKRASCCKHL